MWPKFGHLGSYNIHIHFHTHTKMSKPDVSDKLEMQAKRASSDMRSLMGFYPTNKGNASEWNVFVRLVDNVIRFLKKEGIFGGNIRGDNLTKIADFSSDESHKIWSFARENNLLKNLYPTRQSVDAHVFATMYTVMGAYDKYCNSKKEGGRPAKKPRSEYEEA